ncbi:MAG TPA: aldo/keto reductase [Alphaproteobacteria bacterium]|nr:aldo/keto reductase [Alphaproteobacteria bacterium]
MEPRVSVEPEYSTLKRAIDKKLILCCTHYNVGILPYCPLASGFLTGKHRRGQPAGAGTRFAGQSQRAATILTAENFDVEVERMIQALEVIARDVMPACR